jgi:hypothetical protein
MDELCEAEFSQLIVLASPSATRQIGAGEASPYAEAQKSLTSRRIWLADGYRRRTGLAKAGSSSATLRLSLAGRRRDIGDRRVDRVNGPSAVTLFELDLRRRIDVFGSELRTRQHPSTAAPRLVLRCL